MSRSMQVSTQVMIARGAVAGAALLLAADVALSAAAIINLSKLHTTLMATRQLDQVRIDMTNNLLVAAFGAVVVSVLTVFMWRRSTKVRTAVWVVAPILALATLCFLVGGPEWAVAPTGEEPEALRAEYARAVPGWYVTLHGITGLLAAALLVFAAIFLTRGDLREYYLDDVAANTGYRSWVDRTGPGSSPS